MHQTISHQLPLALILMGALSCSAANAEQTYTTQGFKAATGGTDELANAFNRADGLGNSQVRANSPLLAVPLSLARFMFPKSLGRGRGGGGGDQATLMMGVSNKRSAQGSVASGGLDTLIGASGLGKRSVPSDYINIEPMFGGRPVSMLRGALAPTAARSRNQAPPSWEPTAMELFEAANEA